uniref:EH domain-containing protein n=1 Tax=Theropithecus gelada TaxID=9565 RepID=A0A8D2K480_THEGE
GVDQYLWFCLQIPTGNLLCESYYKQISLVDPAYTGRVGASEAALFLKKSGLSDIILRKIWDLADPEGKGFLDKQVYTCVHRATCRGGAEPPCWMTSVPPSTFLHCQVLLGRNTAIKLNMGSFYFKINIF